MDTCTAIRETLMRRYARERMEHISVKALCADVPVARTTFYAHYGNIDEVLEEVEDELLAGLAEVTLRVSGGDLQHMDFPVFLDETLAYVQDRWADFEALIIKQPDARFIAKWKDAIKANFAQRYPESRMLPNWELIAEMAASAAIGAYTFWMRHPDANTVEDAKQLVTRALAGVMSAL